MTFKSIIIPYHITILVCMLCVGTYSFETGTERSFSFVNDVNVYELKTAAESSIGYRISGDLKVASIYGDSDNGYLFKYELLSPKLYLEKFKVSPIQYDDDSSSIFDKKTKLSFYAFWKAGIIERAFMKDTKETSMNNFIKSILSLFQFQLLDTEREEKDVTGVCRVKYVAKSSTKFFKIKKECSNDFEFHERLDIPLGTDRRFTRVNVITTTADGIVDSIHSSDSFMFHINAYPNTGFKVGSLFYLRQDGEIKDCEVLKVDDIEDAIKTLNGFKEINLAPDFDNKTDAPTLLKLIKEEKDNLKNEDIGKETSALSFVRLLRAGRKAKTDEFLRILNARSTQEIKNQLIDLLAAVQTDESHKAFKQFLNYTNEEHADSIERYLQSLSVGVQPRESVVRDLLEVVQSGEVDNEKILNSLVQTISSMTHKLAKTNKNEMVKTVEDFLTESIKTCTDRTEVNECKVMYIRGLLNLQSLSSLSTLVDLALYQPYQTSVMAMKALSRFSSTHLLGLKRDLKKVFYETTKRFDSSARTIALDILLDLNPSDGDIGEFIKFLKSEDSAYEVKQYLVQKLRLRAEKCSDFAQKLKIALSSDPEANNWNIYGAMKGLSTALNRGFSHSPSFNGSMTSVQEIKGGVLKRGSVDMLMEFKDEKLSLFTLGLFAGGLSSFVSSSDEEVDPDEDTTATAGMELAVQGSFLRPLTFFKGQGELMSHVWSGTASEPTSAYQGITLLQDHSQKIILNNGILLDFTASGAMSMDLSGKFEISLWYKNANSEVVQNIGIALLTSLTLESPIATSSVQITLTQQPQISLASKIDFSSKTAICMMLSQPDGIMTQRITRKVDIPEAKKEKALRNDLIMRYKISGKTHVLNQKNNDMCNTIPQ